MKKIVMVIPSLEPDEKLVNFLEEFTKEQKKRGASCPISEILLVNDGSSFKYNHIFESCIQKYDCLYLKHAVNLGKGRAIKTAINHVLNNFPDSLGIITVDADGQHGVNDIFKCAEIFLESPDKLVLGCRNFNQRDVPAKSSLGNKITRQFFVGLTGLYVSDTQTGLRVIPKDFMTVLLSLKGERFEYELNMLLEAKERSIQIKEALIETIYIEENRSSHFRPLLDSVRVYSVFLKFLMSSTSSFLIDNLIFNLALLIFSFFGGFTYEIYISFFIARLISSLFNYAINKNIVFKNVSDKWTMTKYYTLAVVQFAVAASLTSILNSSNLLLIHVGFIKIAVDILLFLISFPIQRVWVFKKHNNKVTNK